MRSKNMAKNQLKHSPIVENDDDDKFWSGSITKITLFLCMRIERWPKTAVNAFQSLKYSTSSYIGRAKKVIP